MKDGNFNVNWQFLLSSEVPTRLDEIFGQFTGSNPLMLESITGGL